MKCVEVLLKFHVSFILNPFIFPLHSLNPLTVWLHKMITRLNNFKMKIEFAYYIISLSCGFIINLLGSAYVWWIQNFTVFTGPVVISPNFESRTITTKRFEMIDFTNMIFQSFRLFLMKTSDLNFNKASAFLIIGNWWWYVR